MIYICKAGIPIKLVPTYDNGSWKICYFSNIFNPEINETTTVVYGNNLKVFFPNIDCSDYDIIGPACKLAKLFYE